MEDGEPLSGSECDFPLQLPPSQPRYSQDINNNNSGVYNRTQYPDQAPTVRTRSSDQAVQTQDSDYRDKGFPEDYSYQADKCFPEEKRYQEAQGFPENRYPTERFSGNPNNQEEKVFPETIPTDSSYPEGNPMYRRYLEADKSNPKYTTSAEIRDNPENTPKKETFEPNTSLGKPATADSKASKTSSASLRLSSSSISSRASLANSDKPSTEQPPLYSQEYLDYISNMAAQQLPSDGDNTIEGIAHNFMERIQRIEEENRYLKDKVRVLDEENKRLLDDKVKMAEKMRPMEDQTKRLANENKLLRTEMESMSKANQKLRDENEALNKKLSEAKKERSTKADKAVKEQIEKLEDKIKELEHEKTKAENRIEAKEKENQSMDRLYKEELDKMKQEVDKAYEQCNQMRDNVHYLEEENRKIKDQKTPDLSCGKGDDGLKRYIEDLKKENRDLEQDKVNLRRAYDDLKDDYDKLKDSVRRSDRDGRSREGQPYINGDQARDGPDRQNDSFRSQPSNDYSSRERIKTPPGSAGQRIKEIERQADSLKATNASLSHLLREKEDYIKDLEDEKKDLRAAIDGYKKELERIRLNRASDVRNDKYQDMAEKHRRLLEENKRLRTLMAHRNIEDTNATTERLEMKDELDTIKGKLDSANARVKQLEGYMDEIFEDDNFEMINKNRSSGSLPDIQRSPVIVVDPHYMTPRTTRKTRSSMSLATPRSVPKPSGVKTYSNYTYKPGWTAKF